MRTRFRRIAHAFALAAFLTASMQAARADDPVIIPSSARDVEGNSDNLYPFNGNPMRYQQVIAASEFPAGPRTITRIALRADSTGGRAFSETLGHIRINLSTSAKAPGSLSLTFADNVGPDDRTVFDGAMEISSEFAGPAEGPKTFDILITLSSPFTYDPSAGSLLIDVRSFSGGRTTQLDAHDAPSSSARVWSDDVDATTAKADDPFPSVGLVIQFLGD